MRVTIISKYRYHKKIASKSVFEFTNEQNLAEFLVRCRNENPDYTFLGVIEGGVVKDPKVYPFHFKEESNEKV